MSVKKATGIGCSLILALIVAVCSLGFWFVHSHSPIKAHGTAVLCLAMNPDGKRLLSGSKDGTLRLWDVSSGSQVRTFIVPKQRDDETRVLVVAQSPDGRFSAAGLELPSWEGAWKVGLVIFDTATGAEIIRQNQEASVWGLAFSPDGRHLVTGGQDGALRVWDVSTWHVEKKSVLVFDEINGLAYAPDSQHLAVAYGKHGRPKGVKLVDLAQDQVVWNDSTEQIVHSLSFPLGASRLAAAIGSEDESSSPTTSIIGNSMYYGQEVKWYSGTPGSRNSVLILDAKDGKLLHELIGHRNWVMGAALSADGRRVVSMSRDNTIRLWDAESGLEVRQMQES